MTMQAVAISARIDPAAAMGASVPDSPAGLIRLPRGLPGFSSARSFRLEPPAAAGTPFMQLRSTEHEMLGFMVLPVPDGLRILTETDTGSICRELGIETEDLLLLLMVTLEPRPAGLAAFANLRAPLFVDTERRLGWQVVLPASDHPVRHPLRAPL